MLAETRDGDEQRSVFAKARRVVTWHYQWIIVNEFLPQIIGASLVRDILTRGRRFYTPRRGQQSIPVEFQGAAYRFGHSMVRPSYRANLAGDAGNQPFFGFVFDPAGEGQAIRSICGAARGHARRFIGWQTFFDFGGAQTANVRPPKVIDTKISTPLFNLPLGAIASGDAPTSLPQRNLLRHLTWSLPSGQAIARQMNIPPIGSEPFERARPVRRRPRAKHAALVLRAQGGRARRRAAARRGWRANRGRSLRRPAGPRRRLVPVGKPALEADAAQPRARHLHDG